jgi:putative transposase
MVLLNERSRVGCSIQAKTAYDYRDMLMSMRRCMSRKTVSTDNAIEEFYFHAVKAEGVQRKIYDNKIEAMAEIVSFIHFYNNERLRSSLSFQSPQRYENLCA